MLSALFALAFIAAHGQPTLKELQYLKFATVVKTIILLC
jgi:hypothetical protein